MNQVLLGFAAVSGLIMVAMGAFGAHGLKNQLTQSLMSAYETGVQYQAIHTLAILACCILANQYEKSTWFLYAACAFAVGIILFSGSLYGLALTSLRWLGPVTPIGGLFFIAGWLMLLTAAVKQTGE